MYKIITMEREFASGGNERGSMSKFDLCLDSSSLGIDLCVDILAGIIGV